MLKMSWMCLLILLTITIVCASKQSYFENGSAKEIFHRLDELERRVEEQNTETELLREQSAELKRLREENGELKKAIDRLTANDALFNKNIAELEDHVRTLSSRLDQQKVDASEGEGGTLDKTKQVKTEVDNKKVSTHKFSHNRIRQLDQGSTVAFFASMSVHAEHLGQHQPVVFDRAVTNVGQAYHNTTGIFIAPTSGVYVFSTTILTYKESAEFQFVVNGLAYSNMISYSSETYETLSQTIILNLSKGDDVAIQSHDSDKFANGNHFSTFSGFLLAQRDGDIIVG